MTHEDPIFREIIEKKKQKAIRMARAKKKRAALKKQKEEGK